ncbi:hypothetical protein LOTGIDRAFT_171628 [Lottia gigantea]|uniref:Uncharacterized protein n=1 Tax=Lottia gigantea TaxID=225164 RepID=V4BB71_LOTGI|nr:hypothetical protein LOTGIDRAFT_171628 [Lottia gigantea]ESP03282.1 hypothetical protein LOTGIDRAFT_171628 [Lottia gigantea]
MYSHRNNRQNSPQSGEVVPATVSSPEQDLNETVECETSVAENKSAEPPLSVQVRLEEHKEISNPGALCPPIIPPEIEYEDEVEITMIDQSLDIENANDLDFVPDTESESDSEYDQDPPDEQPLSTDFEDIESFSVPENAADERKFLVFESCVVNLFRKCQKTGCAAEVLEFKRTVVGSRLIVST